MPNETQTSPTVNQVIAYNLQRARRHRGLTQDQAAELLEPYLGVRWSRASFSAAERSADAEGRIRQFDANELAAFASTFELPLGWFFMPPPDASEIRTARSDGASLTPAMLVDLLLVTGLSELGQAFLEYLERVPAPERTERQWELAMSARIASDTFMRKELGDLGELEQTFHELAERVGTAAARVDERLRDALRTTSTTTEASEGESQ